MGCPFSCYTLFFEARSLNKPGADSARLKPKVPSCSWLWDCSTHCLSLYVARDPDSSAPPAEPSLSPICLLSQVSLPGSLLPLPVTSLLSTSPVFLFVLTSLLYLLPVFQCRKLLVITKHVQCLEPNNVQAKHKSETEKPKPTPHPHPQTPTAEIPGCCCPEQLLPICLSSLFCK